MTYRPSRVLRDRLSAKRKAPRIARSVTLDRRRGLILEGTPLPFHVGQEVTVTRLAKKLVTVDVSIFAESFDVPQRQPKGTTLTIIDECGE